MTVYAALAERSAAAVLGEFGGRSFSVFKTALADLAVGVLAPIAGELRRLAADPETVRGVLRRGAERARTIADETVAETRETMGLLAP